MYEAMYRHDNTMFPLNLWTFPYGNMMLAQRNETSTLGKRERRGI
jgi:hypothetical protein